MEEAEASTEKKAVSPVFKYVLRHQYSPPGARMQLVRIDCNGLGSFLEYRETCWGSLDEMKTIGEACKKYSPAGFVAVAIVAKTESYVLATRRDGD